MGTISNIIDVDQLRRNTCGDRDLVSELISVFQQELPGIQSAIFKARGNLDAPAIARAAHKLKGQATQDGRPLRRYRRRWRIERLFAWLHWFRRLVTRWEYHIENFVGMVRLGCIKLLLRHI